MTMPFYVSPEQIIKDKADYARKGIARGRSVVVAQYDEGILFVAENPSRALHKISEIYDRVAFAAVGRYNEFENLRIAGVRLADMRGEFGSTPVRGPWKPGRPGVKWHLWNAARVKHNVLTQRVRALVWALKQLNS